MAGAIRETVGLTDILWICVELFALRHAREPALQQILERLGGLRIVAQAEAPHRASVDATECQTTFRNSKQPTQ